MTKDQKKSSFGGFQDAFTHLGGGGNTDKEKPKDPTEGSEDKKDADQENEKCSDRS